MMLSRSRAGLAAAFCLGAGASAMAAQAPNPAAPAAAPAPLVGAAASQGLAPAAPDGAGVGGAARVLAEAIAAQSTGNIEEAIAAGDVKRIMELGGRPTDVVDAMRSILARDPAAMLVPGSTDPRNARMKDIVQAFDRYVAAGFTPVFIHDDQFNYVAAQRADGVTLTNFFTTGMNGAGQPLLGEVYAPTREQQTLASNNRMIIDMPPTLDAAIAAGSISGVRFHGGTMLDYREAMLAQALKSNAQALSTGNAAQIAQAQRQVDAVKMDIAIYGEQSAATSAGPFERPALTLNELRAQNSATGAR